MVANQAINSNNKNSSTICDNQHVTTGTNLPPQSVLPTSSTSTQRYVDSSTLRSQNGLSQDQFDMQINVNYLQTPKSDSSSFQNFPISGQSLHTQYSSNMSPITPNLNSSPNFAYSVNYSPDLYMTTLETPAAINTSSGSNFSIVNPTGLGLSLNMRNESVENINSQIFPSNSPKTQLGATPLLNSTNEQNLFESPQHTSVNNRTTEKCDEIDFESTHLKSMKIKLNEASEDISTELIYKDRSLKTIDEMKFNSENLDTFLNSTPSFNQSELSIEEFFLENPFESSDVDPKSIKNSKNDNSISEYNDFDHCLNIHDDTDNNLEKEDVLNNFSYPYSNQVEDDIKNNSQSTRKLKKKILSQTTKATPKKILKKSNSFNGQPSLLLSSPSRSGSSSALSLGTSKGLVSPHMANEPAFSFSECSNIFPVNILNNYSFIIENESVNNHKSKKFPMSKAERPILKHSSTFGYFDNSLKSNQEPKPLKSMKSGMTSFQIELQNTQK